MMTLIVSYAFTGIVGRDDYFVGTWANNDVRLVRKRAECGVFEYQLTQVQYSSEAPGFTAQPVSPFVVAMPSE